MAKKKVSKKPDLLFFKFVGEVGQRKKKIKGTIASPSEDKAHKELKSLGIFSSKLKNKTPFKPLGFAKIGKIPPADLAMAFSKIAEQIEVGIKPSRILSSMMFDEFKYNTLLFIHRISLKLKEGQSMADAFDAPGYLPKDIISLIRIGEDSGQIPEIFREISSLLSDRAEIQKLLKKAVMKPAGLLLFSFALIMFIVPAMITPIKKFQASHGVDGLPILTEIVVAVVEFITAHSLIVISGVSAFVFTIITLYKKSKGFKSKADLFMLTAPIIGPFKRGLAVYLTMLNLYILQKAGVSMGRSIKMVVASQANDEYRKDIEEVQHAIKEGVGFAEALLSSTYIPRIYKDMIRQGEETGRIEGELKKCREHSGRTFKETSEFTIAAITKTIGFIVMIVVAIVVVAAYLPMFSMVGKVLEKMG